MRKSLCGIVILSFMGGCNNLPSQYKKTETQYEKMLTSEITTVQLDKLESEYRELLHGKYGPIPQNEETKIKYRLQVLKDLRD
jgi:hypothetical protein